MTELTFADITEPIVVIKINRSYHEGESAEKTYDNTRGCWKNRFEYVEPAKYALAVVFGEVKEVYSIRCWKWAKDLNRVTAPYKPEIEAGRIGFEEELAPEDIRQKYIGKSVNAFFKRGNANPVRVICPE